MVQNSAKPRGRPRSFDPDVVLRLARDAFWTAGYSATSLDDLARATGLNRPSLYAAFGDKRALYIAALRRTREDMAAAMALALGAPGSLREALMRLYAGATAAYLAGEGGQRGCFLIGTGVTESLPDPEIREEMAASIAVMDEAFETRLRRAQAQGELAADADVVALARIATACMNTQAIRARAGAQEAELLAIGRAATDMICAKAPPGLS